VLYKFDTGKYMSFNATTWAFNQSPDKAIQKYLLLILAHRADNKYQCYPSISCLIKDTGMGRRTIQEHLRSLLKQGFISIIERTGSSNLYTLIIKGADDEKSTPFFQQSSKKTAPHSCEKRIQNKSINKYSLSKEKENKAKKMPPADPPSMDNFNPEMKKAYDWAKKEPFWSSRIEKIVNFIRFYTEGDLKNQYLNFLRKQKNKFAYQSRQYKTQYKTSAPPPPAKKIRPKELWERDGFKSKKDYDDYMAKKTMDRLRKSNPEAFDPKRKLGTLELSVIKIFSRKNIAFVRPGPDMELPSS
jgi:DNA-binding transcriptional ArsR family regulator